MNDILLIVIAVLILVIAGFLIPLLIEVKRTVVSLRKLTEDKLNPVLEELNLTLKNMRTISDNVNDVTSDVKRFSHTINEAGQTVSNVKELIEKASSSSAIKVISLGTGIRAAFKYLLNNLIKKGDRK